MRTLGAGHDESAMATDATPNDALNDRLERGRSCVELLHRRWPWPGVEAEEKEKADEPAECPDASADELTRAIEPAVEPISSPTMHLGRYLLRALIGSGGHGLVFLAEDPTLRRKVALKVPRPEWLNSDSLRTRFLREAQAVARLEHPGIVPIYDFGESGSVCYLAAAYVDGPNLADWLARSPQPSARLAARLTLDLCEAMAHAHERGVLHRDLKPSNIVLESCTDGDMPVVPRITDFGLAKLLDEVGDTTWTGGFRLGTPGYAAPEQSASQGRRTGPSADIFGLGAILQTLLTGRPPAGPIQSSSARDNLADRPDLPEALRAILARCLQAEPEDRYPTALALADDLRRYLSGAPVKADLLRRRRLCRWMKTHSRALVSVAAIVTTLVLARLGSLNAKLSRTSPLPRSPAAIPAKPKAAIVVRPDADARVYGQDTPNSEETRRARYVAEIHRATRMIRENGEVRDAENILNHWDVADTTAADLRGFEWGFLKRLAHREVLVMRHDRGEVYHVRYSADGRLLISAGQDGTARIWDSETGSQRHVLRHGGTEVNWACFSPDGWRAATASDDGAVRIWDTTSAQLVREIAGAHGRKDAVCVLFLPDGTRLVSAGRDGQIVLWDAASGRAIDRGDSHVGEVETLDLSADGSFLLAAGLGLSQFSIGATTLEHRSKWYQTKDQLLAVAIARDGRRSALSHGRSIHLWEQAGATKRVMNQPARIFSLAFSPDGSWLAAVGDEFQPTIKIWDLATGTPRDELMGHLDRIWCVQWSPDGKRLASASRDGTIKLWDPALRQDRIIIPMPDDIRPVTYGVAPEGTTLLVTGNTGRTISIDIGNSAWTSPRPVSSAPAAPAASFLVESVLAPHGLRYATSPDGRLMAERINRFVHLRDAASHAIRMSLPGHGDEVYSVAFSADGKRLASGDRIGSVRLWDLVSGEELIALEGHSGPVDFLQFTPDGSRLVGASAHDHRIVVWRAR